MFRKKQTDLTLPQATASQKYDAYEWLREYALSNKPGNEHAAIACLEILNLLGTQDRPIEPAPVHVVDGAVRRVSKIAKLPFGGPFRITYQRLIRGEWVDCDATYSDTGKAIDMRTHLLKQAVDRCPVCHSTAEIELPKVIAEATRVAKEIVQERYRQITQEGHTAEQDDRHMGGELSTAGACYVLYTDAYPNPGQAPADWPFAFDSGAWKPKDFRRDLIRALALITAEVELFDRRQQKAGDGHD